MFNDPEKHKEFQNLDALATQHLNEFWANYVLQMKIDVEHKLDRTAIAVGYFRKADYAVKIYDESEKSWCKYEFAIRGATRDFKAKYQHPAFNILLVALGDKEIAEIRLDFEQVNILRIREWIIKQKSENTTELQKAVRPGEAILSRLGFNSVHFYSHNSKNYRKKYF